MSQLEELFVIKSVENDSYFIDNWRLDNKWSRNISEATNYSSYTEASTKLSTDNDIPEGMYQIEKFFKKPEIDYGYGTE